MGFFKWIRKGFRKAYQAWNEPPDHVLNKNVSLKAALASDWREIIIIDGLIWAFLLSSIHQMAFVFGKGAPEFFDYSKAFGLDGVIWILSRSLAKSSVLSDRLAALMPKQPRKKSDSDSGFWKKLGNYFTESVNWNKVITQLILWAGLLVFLFFTTSFNMVYERWDKSAPAGIINLVDPQTDGEEFVRNMSSVYLAFVVIFLSFVRMILTKNISTSYRETEERIENIDREEQHREKERERMRRRRARLKAEKEAGVKSIPVKRGRPTKKSAIV